MTAIWAIWIWSSIARSNFVTAIYFNNIEKTESFNSQMGYKILRSHSPEEFFIALAIGLLLKSNTAINLILHSLAIRQDPIDDEKSTLVQVMACCCQAASHYLNQCRPKFTSPYDVTGPQWIKPIVLAPWWSYVLFKLTLLYNQSFRKNSIPLCCVMQICWEASFIPV